MDTSILAECAVSIFKVEK